MAPIRRAVPADCADIAVLIQQYWAFENIEGFNQDRIVVLLQKFVARPEQGCCWVAGSKGVPRGYLLATFLFSLEFGGTMAEIDELFVLPEFRADGLGSRLVEKAVTQMQRSGLVHVQLQLGARNLRAREFYRRQGFTSRCGYELLGRQL